MLIGHSQGSLHAQQLIAREIETNAVVAATDEAGDHARLQRAGARRASWSAGLQDDPAVQPDRPDRLRHQPGPASARRTSRPPGAIFGLRRQPGHDRRLRQSGAAGRERLGAARQLLVRALEPARARRPDRLVERGPAADALLRDRGPRLRPLRQRRPARLSRRSAPTPTPRTSAPTASAAKSAMLGMFLPGWGMHLADMAAAQGDLIRQVGEIGRVAADSGSTPATSGPAKLALTDLDTPYRGGFVGPRAPFRPDRLFRGHRHRRHRLLRQLSEVHGARPLGHAARGRGRPERTSCTPAAGAYYVAECNIRYRGRRGSARNSSCSARVEQVRAASVEIHQRVMRESGTVDRRPGDRCLPRCERPAAAAAERLGRTVQEHHEIRMTARFAPLLPIVSAWSRPPRPRRSERGRGRRPASHHPGPETARRPGQPGARSPGRRRS